MEPSNLDPEQLLQMFSDVVRARRELLGFSQEELGVRAGLHRTYISDVECGARNLSLKTLCRLSHALQTTPSALIGAAEKKLDPTLASVSEQEDIPQPHQRINKD